ncbi:MAG: hypothetical protein WDZ76_02425 [Pseudohongiellaceae bacterium]
MKRRTLTSLFCVVALASVATYGADDYQAPRTVFGHPDLQGIWTNATQTPLERPVEFGTKGFFTDEERLAQEQEWKDYIAQRQSASDPDRPPPTDGNTDLGYDNFWVDMGTDVIEINGEYRTSIIVDPPNGRIPYAEGARERLMARFANMSYDGPEARPLGERCLLSFGSSSGPPMLPVMYNNNYQIVQTEDYVMILVEMVHDARIIRLDDEHLPGTLPKWMGDSVGHWERDTLVVETANFRDEQLFRGATENLTITERFTRTADNKIVYSFTMDDPQGYATPWTGEIPMYLRPEESARMYEYACHEGNYALSGILAGARRQEAEQAD